MSKKNRIRSNRPANKRKNPTRKLLPKNQRLDFLTPGVTNQLIDVMLGEMFVSALHATGLRDHLLKLIVESGPKPPEKGQETVQ